MLLRKCKILAARLDHQPFAEWVEWELNGYPSDQVDRLPAYRRLQNVEARGNFSGGFGHYINYGLIAQECVDDEDRNALFSINLTQGVAEYEALVGQSQGDKEKGSLRSPWPTAAVIKYAERIWEMYACTEAWRVVSPAALSGLLEAIRNRVLSFALDIEREDPTAGEAPLGSAPVPKAAVERAFVVNVMGGSPVITGGNVATVVQLAGLDWDGLTRELLAHGLPDTELQALSTALLRDRKSVERGEIGPATEGWIGRVTTKIETGGLDVATGATGGVIAGVILKALGAG